MVSSIRNRRILAYLNRCLIILSCVDVWKMFKKNVKYGIGLQIFNAFEQLMRLPLVDWTGNLIFMKEKTKLNDEYIIFTAKIGIDLKILLLLAMTSHVHRDCRVKSFGFLKKMYPGEKNENIRYSVFFVWISQRLNMITVNSNQPK